jgi:Zn-dependent protease
MSSSDPDWRPPTAPPAEPSEWRQSTPPGSGYGYPPPSAPRQRRSGLVGWITAAILVVVGWFKYAVLLLKLVPGLTTLVSLLVSFALYTAFWGSAWAAAGLVLMILVHEMGHVVEIRRQGMKATAPIFIPFLGAAIFQRSHPTDAIKQAQIGIAGPIAGTIGATAAFALYGATRFDVLLFWAWIGFYINLFNLIPFGMLDGGWILAPVSKWFQVLGLGLLLVSVFFIGFSPILLLLVLLGLPMVLQRFRSPQLDAYYRRAPLGARYAMGLAWLVLALYLAFASFEAHKLLAAIVG